MASIGEVAITPEMTGSADDIVALAMGGELDRDPARVAAMALGAMSQSGAESRLVGLAIMALALGGASGDLVGLLDWLDRGPTDSLGYTHVLFQELIEMDRGDIVAAARRALPPKHPVFPLALYFEACRHIKSGATDAAFDLFEAFQPALAGSAHGERFIQDVGLNVVYRQATQVASAERVERILAASVELPPACSEIAFSDDATAGQEPPLVASCADARYIERFAPGWVAALAKLDPRPSAHLHIVDPTPGALALIESLRLEFPALNLGLSTSRGLIRSATVYACARFDVLPLLGQRTGRRIIATDIDIAVTPCFQDLFEPIGETDFALFETGRFEPASVFQASIQIINPTPAAWDFLRDVARYSRHWLRLPTCHSWMIDQAALFSVGHARERAGRLRFARLDRLFGRPYQAYWNGLARDEEKRAMTGELSGAAD